MKRRRVNPAVPTPATALRRLRRRAAGILAPLLALLALLGGAAFQLRSGGGGLGGAVAAIHTAAPSSGGGAGHHGHAQPATEHTPQATKQRHAAHDHSAHCPFCVTQAFAGDLQPLWLPPGPPDFVGSPPARTGQVWPVRLRHFDTRAPPRGRLA